MLHMLKKNKNSKKKIRLSPLLFTWRPERVARVHVAYDDHSGGERRLR